MSFNTASAILRGKWLLNQEWAFAHLPFVAKALKGEAVDFGTQKNKLTLGLISAVDNSRKVYNVYPGSNISQVDNGSIAVVNLTGPMIKHGDMCTDGMIDQAALIAQLGSSNNISAIILNIDSPGGQADGTALLADEIKAAGTKKPVIAVINDGMAASAAMWIASAANEIYVTQFTDQVGSIGVYTTIADWASYYESQGLTIKEIYAPQSTDKNKGYYDALAGDESLIKEDLRILADQFINTISTNRAGKIKGYTWASGKMFYAADAKKIGLIDGIKSFSQVVGRINTILSQQQQSKSNTMAFEKTMLVAKATDFTVTDDGFLLSEEHLNNIEASLATIEEAGAAVIALENANAAINILTAERDSAIGEFNSSANTIQQLRAEVAALGAAPSGSGTVITTKEDPKQENEAVPSYLDDSNPINQFADKQIRKK